ncbi:MAG TPA: hypothetical protein VE010_14125, partial [Thermoanaerobaculia bacterium]|nr:hypothetical protein [Thermoanaerobaculia bacterium]
MHNVFIAIGGSGTKVADMLVRLLALGFPTSGRGGELGSAQDSLEIWCVDPDRSSASMAALKKTVSDYVQLQSLLSDPKTHAEQGRSEWAIAVDPNVRHLDPLQLDGAIDARGTNQVKSLGGILDSGDRGKRATNILLRAFYQEKDLAVCVDRGFYQKPFIGAPIMAVFADSLRNENSPGGRTIQLRALQQKPVRFFLAGSLHGGTGACGVPVLGRFLADLRHANQALNWRIGACLLAPYAFPPEPPFTRADAGTTVTDALVESRLSAAAAEAAFRDLTPEEKRQLARQILEGFYADPAEMDERARHALLYYKDHGAKYFDELYLVGKPEADRLPTWSNGGRNQQNPYNVAETVGALAALNFIGSQQAAGNEGTYRIPTSTPHIVPKAIRVQDLPLYGTADMKIDPEKVLLATGVLHHLVLRQIPWDEDVQRWSGIERLKSRYASELTKREDSARFSAALEILQRFATELLNPDVTAGWREDDLRQLSSLFSDDPDVAAGVTEKLRRKSLFNA